LFFDYGRYLLIASSRAGGQPANLQGLWNDSNTPPWDSKYTVNINTEMNYWLAEPANLAELTEPLFHLLRDVAVSGRATAREHYDARGWVLHHNTDLWRGTATDQQLQSRHLADGRRLALAASHDALGVRRRSVHFCATRRTRSCAARRSSSSTSSASILVPATWCRARRTRRSRVAW
jgi:hypothetical protein